MPRVQVLLAVLCALHLPQGRSSPGLQLVSEQQKHDPLADAPWDDQPPWAQGNKLTLKMAQQHLYNLADHTNESGTASTYEHRAPTLPRPEIHVQVQVILVGFNGDGFGKLQLQVRVPSAGCSSCPTTLRSWADGRRAAGGS